MRTKYNVVQGNNRIHFTYELSVCLICVHVHMNIHGTWNNTGYKLLYARMYMGVFLVFLADVFVYLCARACVCVCWSSPGIRRRRAGTS